MGIDWSLREGYAWAEDKEHCEEYGRMLQAPRPFSLSFQRLASLWEEMDEERCEEYGRMLQASAGCAPAENCLQTKN